MKLKYINSSKSIVLLVILLFCTTLNSQISSNVDYYKEKYATSNKINLNKENHITISIVNDKIQIVQSISEEDLYLNESATQFSKESVNYSSFFHLNKIEASSFNLENGKYIEYKVNEFRKKDELDGSFYDDVKSLNFIYSNLNPNSKTKLKIEESIENPRFLNAFFFGGYYPILKAKLTLTVDKGIDLDFKEFNTDSISITVKKIEKRNKTIYTFETQNIDAIKIEDGTPDPKYYYPHIVPIITQYKTKNNETVYLSSTVSELYKWYYSLVKDINNTPSSNDLIDLVNKLTVNKNSEIEKVRSIYYWVQNNIKYIAFEYALGGFIPRNANDVFMKKFGDCKDNSSILFEMLKLAKIKGQLTWIGTRSIPYRYEELPTPACDNHMILTYQNEGNTYFLDATGRFIPLEFPSSFIQGKEALVGFGKDSFEIIKVPIIDSYKNTINDYSELYIEEELIKGKAAKKFTGYSKIDVFNKLEGINSDKKLKEYYKDLLLTGNNKFSFSNVTEINKYSYDEDFELNYDFIISDYIVKSSNEIFINLNLDKKLL